MGVKNVKIAIVGSGMVGLAAAERLSEGGHEVVVFERDDRVGGLAAGFTPLWSDASIERFYHHIFESDHAFVTLVHRMGLSKRLEWKEGQSSCFYDGRLHRLDSAASLLAFSPLPIFDRLRLGLALGLLKMEWNAKRFRGIRATAWLRRVAGNRAFSIVFEPLFRSKFGRHADSIGLSWFWARIRDRTPKLGYVRGGFQHLYEELAKATRKNGGEIRVRTSVTKVTDDKRGLTVFTVRDSVASSENFDSVLLTCPIATLRKIITPLSESFIRAHTQDNSLAARCFVIALDRPLTDRYWINMCEPESPFMVAVEHTNLMDHADYGNKHVVYLGNYAEKFDVKSPEQLLTEFEPTLKKLNSNFDRSWIVDSWIFSAPYAQPIVTVDYESHIPPTKTLVPRLFIANLEQVFPHDRGQNYAIELAYQVCAQIDNSRASVEIRSHALTN